MWFSHISLFIKSVAREFKKIIKFSTLLTTAMKRYAVPLEIHPNGNLIKNCCFRSEINFAKFIVTHLAT